MRIFLESDIGKSGSYAPTLQEIQLLLERNKKGPLYGASILAPRHQGGESLVERVQRIVGGKILANNHIGTSLLKSPRGAMRDIDAIKTPNSHLIILLTWEQIMNIHRTTSYRQGVNIGTLASKYSGLRGAPDDLGFMIGSRE